MELHKDPYGGKKIQKVSVTKTGKSSWGIWKSCFRKNTDSVGHLTHLPRRLPCKPSPLRTPCGPVPEGFPVLAASQGCPQCAPHCGKGGNRGQAWLCTGLLQTVEKKKVSNCPLAQMLKVWLFLWLRMLRSLVLVKIKDVYVRPIKTFVCFFITLYNPEVPKLELRSDSVWLLFITPI